MQAVADLLDTDEMTQELGTVRRTGEELDVATSRGSYRARVAASCLVEPLDGDRVLVATDAAGRAYVLAVLERAADEPVRLRVEGDLSVTAGGRIRFVARDGVDIATERDVKVVGRELGVTMREANFLIDAIGYVGKVARIDTGKIKSVVGLLDQVAERFSLKAKRSYRFIDEVDITRAEEVDVRARGTFNARGKNAVMNAEELVKVDAKQIHLG